MSNLATLEDDFPITAEYLTPIFMEMPQAPCSVYHRFGPNIYIRELHMKAGTMAIGHKQRFEHINILLKGKVQMFNDDNSVLVLEAPLFFIGSPGRKVGLVLEDVVWQNIYSTSETDITTLENLFLDKSELGYAVVLNTLTVEEVSSAQKDYLNVLTELNITEEEIQKQVELEYDVTYVLPSNIRITDSQIHGKGVFITSPCNAGDVLAYGRLNSIRTAIGRYTNHSGIPNCQVKLLDNGDAVLVALVDLVGCLGGNVGQELTIDYRNVTYVNPQVLRK
jgi:hypothetical protein